MKSQDEIKTEIQALTNIKPKVRQFSSFGDDNHAQIDAQIEVLSKGLTEDYIDDEVSEEDDIEIRNAMQDVIDWRDEDGDLQSAEWAAIAGK